MIKTTVSAVREAIKALPGMEVKRLADTQEYRINFKAGKESTAYYTDDAADAISTARAMHARRFVQNLEKTIRERN